MTEHCDLVMKGGITSGVVYPKLIAQLASKYQFKNIGGTSAGAIAAGACAAAQYGKNNGHDAFKELEQLPYLLGDTNKEGMSKLFRLFQPAMSLHKHFSVFVRVLNRKPRDATAEVLKGLGTMYKKGLSVGLLLGSLLLCPFITALHSNIGVVTTLVTALCMMLLVAGFTTLSIFSALNGQSRRMVIWLLEAWALMSLALMVVTGQGLTWQLLGSILAITVTALLFFQTIVLATIALLFVRGLLNGLHGNNYGVCSGKSAEGNVDAETEGLTDWMTSYFNTLAGLPPTGHPLTFGQLWGDNPKERLINLEMMTTAVSQQMVYGLPFRPGIAPFYYDPIEWAALFPAHVMAYLNTLDTGTDAANDKTMKVISPTNHPLRLFARPNDLPVVVAVRMSLSFPLLLSAIPLYAIDWSLNETAKSKENNKPIVAKRVWFSDGGIGSNMPLHMFDSLLPDHPTFAINLKPTHPSHKINEPETKENEDGRVYLPTDNRGGRQRFWSAPDDKMPLGGLAGFFISIVNTMQSWRDELMFPYPGFRDRIIQISLNSEEGGLNLNMPKASIDKLGNAGKLAADRLIEHFHPQGGENGKGWDAHKQTRLKTFLGVMQPAFSNIAPALASGQWNLPLVGYNQEQRKAATDFLAGVQHLGQLNNAQSDSFKELAPKPVAQVKISPRI